MTSDRTFRPDLNDAVLEDRTLMAYSPFTPQFVLSYQGYVPLTTPPGLSGNLSTMGGGAFGGSGGNMGTSFYLTGFGLSSIAIGNATGYAGVSLSGSSSGGNGGTVTLATQVGSGAAENGGAGGGVAVSRATVAQGATSPVTMYIGQTSGDSPNGGYSGPGARGSAPAPVQAPVPPAPPPG